MLRLSFEKKAAFLVDLNPRSEVHGAEREPAADVKLRVDCDSGILAEFAPALRSMLYFKDESKDADGRNDLADQAAEAPNLRFPHLGAPLKWEEEMTGATLTAHYGIDEKSDIVLKDCRVNDWKIEPREGGTVSVTFRVQCHPDEKTFGRLAMQVQNEVEITLEPQELPSDG